MGHTYTLSSTQPFIILPLPAQANLSSLDVRGNQPDRYFFRVGEVGDFLPSHRGSHYRGVYHVGVVFREHVWWKDEGK